jgi:hypothetical protein
MESASCSFGFSKLNSPAHWYLCLRFGSHLAMYPARLEARMDSLFSFPVGLSHPLQHAGLSRRTPGCRPLVHYPVNRAAWLICRPPSMCITGVVLFRRGGCASSLSVTVPVTPRVRHVTEPVQCR